MQPGLILDSLIVKFLVEPHNNNNNNNDNNNDNNVCRFICRSPYTKNQINQSNALVYSLMPLPVALYALIEFIEYLLIFSSGLISKSMSKSILSASFISLRSSGEIPDVALVFTSFSTVSTLDINLYWFESRSSILFSTSINLWLATRTLVSMLCVFFKICYQKL